MPEGVGGILLNLWERCAIKVLISTLQKVIIGSGHSHLLTKRTSPKEATDYLGEEPAALSLLTSLSVQSCCVGPPFVKVKS